ncbi:hypothetical protein MAXJ12_27543 [Mesorhizobium alhagi CCNWXJ12-2]|uniref:Uncharacterized protein n=2 Tax=Allomesorhizobium alhagi TaxID=475067 RepID=H0HZ72_9HYPH|nr:hypothetical protein MAXJ12_27543 [Mesorhizobium alhagi CCNWXJ12-2]
MRSHFTTIKFLAGTTTFNAPKTAPLQKTATCPLQGRGVGRFPPQRLKSTGAIISANLSAMLTGRFRQAETHSWRGARPVRVDF